MFYQKTSDVQLKSWLYESPNGGENQECTPRPVGRGKGLPCPVPPRKKEALPRPAPPCENYQNLRGAAGQTWFQSIEIWKAITRKDPILSDKYLPHSQISWFPRFFAPPRTVDFSPALPHTPRRLSPLPRLAPHCGLKAPPRASLVKMPCLSQSESSGANFLCLFFGARIVTFFRKKVLTTEYGS